ncbi:MAG: STAS domain-containing protein [Chromatiaceae bacterium]|nr:MAG: STAS domain-containing protein [Chromatiaceae bacterium]
MQCIVLPDSLDISYAAELHALLRDSLQAEEGVELEAAGVCRMDTAGLQLLAAFLREAHTRGVPVRLVEPSEALISAAGRLGLSGIATPTAETL